MRRLRPSLPTLLALAALGLPAISFSGSTLAAKLEEIRARYEKGAAEAKEFQIHETEANDYLRNGAEIPAGIENPWVRFEEGQAVAGATIDLEKFRGNLPSSMMFQLLTGRVPVEATARVEGERGVGKVELLRVLLAGVELPPSVVESIARSEGASAALPDGFRLGEPFDLPYNLESIRCKKSVVPLRQRAATPAE